MKVLQVNCVYRKGSTGKITCDIHTELLRHGIESVVCYGRGEKIAEPNVYKTCGEMYSKANNLLTRLTGIMYGGCFLSTQKLISIIKKEQPDIVHLQCINGYFVNIYRLITWLKNNHIKTVLTLHAEFMFTANCGYALDCDKWQSGCGHCPRRKKETHSFLFDGTHTSWKKMKKTFDGFDENLIVTSVSPWLMNRAKQSPILTSKRHCVIYNGIDTEIFQPISEERCIALREELNIPSGKVVFHATASFNNNPNHIKGGYYLIELAKQMPDVTFVVAGPVSGNPEIPKNMMLLGKISDQRKLAELYAMADVTVLTSQRETFSMVTAESLCCGTPVVGFKAGSPEQIALPEYSEFVEYGDLCALGESVKQMLNLAIDRKKIIDRSGIYSKEHMSNSYQNLYQNMAE